MQIQCRIIAFLFVVICGSAFSAHGQAKDDEQVTPAEKKEIQRVAKRFVKRYQQTRDMRRLIPEFFIDDFARCAQESYVRDNFEDKSKNELSANELLRSYIASMDLMYIHMAAWMYDQDSGHDDRASLSLVFPRQLAKDLLGGDLEFLSENDLADRKVYMKMLVKLERDISRARRHMARKNIEGSAKYLKEFRHYETSDWLGYIVKSGIEDQPSNCEHVPIGTTVYTVTTPIWLVLELVKQNNSFKIYGVLIYDD